VFEWFQGEANNWYPSQVENVDHVAGGARRQECCGRVKAVADDVKHLLLTEEQWEARRRRQCHSEERSSEGSDKHGDGKEGTDVDDERLLLLVGHMGVSGLGDDC
jgi:hypothetical protein